MAIYEFLTRNGIADPDQEAKLALLTAEMAKPGAKILLHLHGGLVDEASGTAAATRLSGAGPNSWNLDAEWTQVYVVWRTGAFETIKTNWLDLVHNDRLYQTVLKKLIGFVARKLGVPDPAGRGAGTSFGLDEDEIWRRITGAGDTRAPFADVDAHLLSTPTAGTRATIMSPQSNGALALEFQDEIAQDRDFQDAVADIDGVVNDGAPGRAALVPADKARGAALFDRLDGRIKAELAPPAANVAAGQRGIVSVGVFLLKHAGAIALRCFRRFRSNRDHGLHATIVEELCRELYGDLVGATIWGMMVKDAADHFGVGGFGAALIKALPASPPADFVVTAHSAGSIWASHMLQAMQSAGQNTPLRLFLLAPAVRQDLFASTLESAGSLVTRCRMFTMDETHERADAVLGHDKGYIYPSSLLYLVSGLFEERNADAYADAPLLGMQRFLAAPWLNEDETKAAAAISAFFQQSDKSVVYSPSEGVTMAESHGSFDDEPFTLKSVHGLF